MKHVIALVILLLVLSCGGEKEESPAGKTDSPPNADAAASSESDSETLDDETFVELIAEFHAFREPKLAECPKDAKAVDEPSEKDRYPIVEELRRRRMLEEDDPQAESSVIQLTLSALSQLFGWSEDEDAYYIPIATREVVSVDRVEVTDQNAVVRFRWKYVPHEIAAQMMRGDAMTAEAKLVDEGDRWRVYDCKGLHPHLYNEHDRIATNQAELTVE